jgi:hypothetical protein
LIHELDVSLRALLRHQAPSDSPLDVADISFEKPDPNWRSALERLTLNCYLYRVHENRNLRRAEFVAERSRGVQGADVADGGSGVRSVGRRRPQAVPIDCSYCLTAWSTASDDDAVEEEHRLLSQVMRALLRHRVRPPQELWGAVESPVRPYPVLSTFAEDLSTPGEFWTALEHPVKPSLNCVLTLALEPDDPGQPDPVELVEDVSLGVRPLAAPRSKEERRPDGSKEEER